MICRTTRHKIVLIIIVAILAGINAETVQENWRNVGDYLKPRNTLNTRKANCRGAERLLNFLSILCSSATKKAFKTGAKVAGATKA